MTKIMNEGWATYWHQKIMTEKILTDAEVIDYAATMAGTLSSSGAGINPYQLGLALWHDIEERWDTGRHGLEWETCDDAGKLASWDTGAMDGRRKIFEVRRHMNDVTFVDEFLTEEFCHRHKLFLYGWNPRTQRREILSRDFRQVKEQLLRQLTNGGHPIIEVIDDNLDNRGELLLAHRWEETDLEDAWTRDTLSNVARIWSRPACLDTHQGGRAVRYRSTEAGDVDVSEL